MGRGGRGSAHAPRPTPTFRSRSFPKEMSQRKGASLEWGLALALHRGVSK